jgi:nitrous oxidase accessory protein NosD
MRGSLKHIQLRAPPGMVKAALTRRRQFDLNGPRSPATIAGMKGLTLIAALGLAGAAEAADIAVADPRALEAALARAAPGDRVLLAPGRYGDLTIGPRRARGRLTIGAADRNSPPVFRSIFLRDAEGVTLETLDVTYGAAAAPLSAHAVEVRRSSDIRLMGLRIMSAAGADAGDDAYGVIVRDSRTVAVSASRFSDVFRGVAIFDSDDAIVSGNEFRRVGSDGVVARGAAGLRIENNTFTDFTPADPARWHPDAVQLWSRGARRGNERVIIRGNVIRRGKGGATQGIFIKTPEIASRDVLIEGNRIEQSMGQGIFVQNGVDVTIRKNVLATVEPALDPPAIEVRAPFETAIVEDNEAPNYRLPRQVEARRNRTVP